MMRGAELKHVYAALLVLLEVQWNRGAVESHEAETLRALELCASGHAQRLGSVFGNFTRHHKKGHRRRTSTTSTQATTSIFMTSTDDDDFVTSHYSTIPPLNLETTHPNLPEPTRETLGLDANKFKDTIDAVSDTVMNNHKVRSKVEGTDRQSDKRRDDFSVEDRQSNKELIEELSVSHSSKMTSRVKKMYRESASSGVNRVNGKSAVKGGIFLTDNCTTVVAQIGTTAILHCEVSDITENTVTWIRRKDYSLLSVGLVTYSSDSRFFSAHGRHVKDWALHVRFVTSADAGYYECQVPTHPPTSLFFKLVLVAAFAEIEGESEKIIHEGSMLRLVCVVRRSTEPPTYVFWYFESRMINYDTNGVSVSNGRQTSELVIERAEPRHAGNYTCVPANARAVSVTVHVVQSETPAAMQHGNNSEGTKQHTDRTAIIFAILVISLRFFHS